MGRLSGLLRTTALRRGVTVPAVAGVAATLGSTAPIWLPAATIYDVFTRPQRMPTLRVASFAWAWSSLETVGVGASTALWALGRGDDVVAHYALQRWWADRLLDALRLSAGLRFEVVSPDGLDPLRAGPLVMAVRHSSIADALLPMWLLSRAGLQPRYVLKDDLLIDPCLDIVGNRVPNHFVDRAPADSDRELAALESLAHNMRATDCAVIYPEGAVITPARQKDAIERVARNDPDRYPQVASLRHLAPVRPRGTEALLRGAPDADLVFVNHRGFEPISQVGRAPDVVPLPSPVRITLRRVDRCDIPNGTAFTAWFDEQWAHLDAELDDELAAVN